MAGQNLAVPVAACGPSKPHKCIEFDIAPLVGIESRVGRKQSSDKTGTIQIMQVELQRGAMVASRYAAHDVVAGDAEAATPEIGRHTVRRSHNQTQ